MNTHSTHQKLNLNCPHCNQIDKVRKASGIWRAAATYSASGSVAGSGSHRNAAGSKSIAQQATLAKRFNPPRKSFPHGIYLVLLGSLPWLLKMEGRPNGSPEWLAFMSLPALFLLGCGVVMMGVYLVRLPQLRRQYRQAAQRWGSLYYCSRCDNAFEIGT